MHNDTKSFELTEIICTLYSTAHTLQLFQVLVTFKWFPLSFFFLVLHRLIYHDTKAAETSLYDYQAWDADTFFMYIANTPYNSGQYC